MNPVCSYCDEPVDLRDPGLWRRVVGWERKGMGPGRRGGSDIVLREARQEWACPTCVARLQAGVGLRQESLL